jgi:hypothetical protein
MNIKQTFHRISYLQYPLMMTGVYFIAQPFFNNFNGLLEAYNFALVFMGLSISFSTLQDTTKTQNKASLKVWQSPTKGKIFLAIITSLALLFILLGLTGFIANTDNALQELSLGLMVIGIGLIGLLQVAIEMFENHRLDSNPPKAK